VSKPEAGHYVIDSILTFITQYYSLVDTGIRGPNRQMQMDSIFLSVRNQLISCWWRKDEASGWYFV